MLAKKLALLTLNEALATGGDYAELYVEDTAREAIKVETGHVESISKARTRGAGLRILKGLRSVYGYTADLSKRGLLSLARKLALAYEGERLFEVKSFTRKKAPSVCPIKDPVIDIPAETRIQFLRAMDEEMRKDARIVRARSEIYGEKKAIEIFAAQDGLAPSQMIPEAIAKVLDIAAFIFSLSLVSSHVIAALTPDAALTAPQNAERRPIFLFS